MTTKAWSTLRCFALAAAMLSLSSVAWAQYGSPAPSDRSGVGAGATSGQTGVTTTSGRSGPDCDPSTGRRDACSPGVRDRDWILSRSGASSSLGWNKDPKVRLPQTDD